VSAHNRFRQFAGVYSCGACGRKTRGSGDSVSCKLCAECYEIGGLENDLSDHQHSPEEVAKKEARIEELWREVISKGGRRSF